METTKTSTSRAVKGNVVGLTKPATIQRIANEKGLPVREIFIRLVLEVKKEEYVVSNKLRFIGEEGYKKLQNALNEKKAVTVYVNPESKFFYMNEINNDVTIEDLFKKAGTSRKDIGALFE